MALVTGGGANGGNGHAIALALARYGAGHTGDPRLRRLFRQFASTSEQQERVLRQQIARSTDKRRHVALSDFVAPKETGIADYVGGFAVTARMLAMYKKKERRDA